jgi:release factor glutamine methyltransferase
MNNWGQMSSWIANAYRFYLAGKFRLWQHRFLREPVLERFGDRQLVILPEVLNPRMFFTGEFMALALSEALIPPGAQLLDMGTGSGIGAIFAARWAAEVDAVDINPAAARCARVNVLLNGLEDRVTVLTGDLFAPVNEKIYDVVLFNPPYFRGEPGTPFERALFAGDVLMRFAQELPQHLAPGGYALVVWSSLAPAEDFQNAFHTLHDDVVAAKRTLAEQFTLHKLTVPA